MGVRKDRLQITITADAAQARKEVKAAKVDIANLSEELTGLDQDSDKYKATMLQLAEAQDRFVKNASFRDIKTEINDLTRALSKTKEGTKQYEILEAQLKPIAVEYQRLGGRLNQFQQNVTGLNRDLQKTPSLMTRIGTAANGMGNKIKAALIGSGIGIALAALSAFYSEFKRTGEAVVEIEKIKESITQLTNLTGDELDAVTVKIVATSRVYKKDYEEVLDSLNTLTNEFGGTMVGNLDLVQKALQGDFRGTLLSDIKEYSTQFERAGFSAQEFLAFAIKTQQEGVFDDKGLDSIKEFGLRINEQTKTTSDALDALGKDFREKLFAEINNGSITSGEALERVVTKIKSQGLNAKELQTIYADVFSGAGEDAGNFIFQLDELELSLIDVIDETTVMARQQERQIELSERLAEEQLKLTKRFEGGAGGLKLFGTQFRIFFTQGLSLGLDQLERFKIAFDGIFTSIIFNYNKFASSLNNLFDKIPGVDKEKFGLPELNDLNDKNVARLKESLLLYKARREAADEEVSSAISNQTKINNLITKGSDRNVQQTRELQNLLQEKTELSDKEQVILERLIAARKRSSTSTSEEVKKQQAAYKEFNQTIKDVQTEIQTQLNKEKISILQTDFESEEAQLNAIKKLEEDFRLQTFNKNIALYEKELKTRKENTKEYIELESKLVETQLKRQVLINSQKEDTPDVDKLFDEVEQSLKVLVDTEFIFIEDDEYEDDFKDFIDGVSDDLDGKLEEEAQFNKEVDIIIDFGLQTGIQNAEFLESKQDLFSQEFDTEEARLEALDQLRQKFEQKQLDRAITLTEEKLATLQEGDEGYDQFREALAKLQIQRAEKVAEEEIEQREKVQQVAEQANKYALDALEIIGGITDIQKQKELNQVDETYSNQIKSIEAQIQANQGNAKVREQLEKKLTKLKGQEEEKRNAIETKFAKKQQAIQLATSIINTATAVTKALTLPFPANLIQAAIIAVKGGIEIAAIKAQQFRGGGFTLEDDKGRPVRNAIDIKQGGTVDKPSYGIIGEDGTEWVANNRTVQDPVTGPVIEWLDKRQRGEAVSDNVPGPSRGTEYLKQKEAQKINNRLRDLFLNAYLQGNHVDSLRGQIKANWTNNKGLFSEFKETVAHFTERMTVTEKRIDHYYDVIQPAIQQQEAMSPIFHLVAGASPETPPKTPQKPVEKYIPILVLEELEAKRLQREQAAQKTQIG